MIDKNEEKQKAGKRMNLINIEHISKIYGEKVIFDDASFGVQQGDKIGIVGINGTGKSTFLKVVAGEEVPDEGQVVRQNGLKIAFVPQNPTFPEGMDIRSYALQDADAESWQVESNLTELGITQWDQKIDTLSGGQKRRVVLAKILAGDFDVLLLDEPTNHLDQEMISWLEDYLRSYRGTVLMVTHDRYFLDRVTNRILTLSLTCKLHLFPLRLLFKESGIIRIISIHLSMAQLQDTVRHTIKELGITQ